MGNLFSFGNRNIITYHEQDSMNNFSRQVYVCKREIQTKLDECQFEKKIFNITNLIIFSIPMGILFNTIPVKFLRFYTPISLGIWFYFFAKSFEYLNRAKLLRDLSERIFDLNLKCERLLNKKDVSTDDKYNLWRQNSYTLSTIQLDQLLYDAICPSDMQNNFKNEFDQRVITNNQ